jgi:DNA replication protein DnaC
MQLRERETELETLAAALEAPGRAGGATVLVSGEAGIGKTSLLSAFAQGAVARARVYWGTCEDLMTRGRSGRSGTRSETLAGRSPDRPTTDRIGTS